MRKIRGGGAALAALALLSACSADGRSPAVTRPSNDGGGGISPSEAGGSASRRDSGAPPTGSGGAPTGGHDGGGDAGGGGGDEGRDAGARCLTACGSHGHCQANACSCDPGYDGANCASCATGYVAGGGGVCVKQSCGAAPCTAFATECKAGIEQMCSVGADGCLSFGAAKNCASGGCWCSTLTAGVMAQEWGLAGSESAFGVAVGLDGAAIATGWASGNARAADNGMFLIGRHLRGASEPDWAVSWSSNNAFDSGRQVLVDPTGGMTVAGQVSGTFTAATSFGGADAALAKWNADRTSAWGTEWGGAAADMASSLARAPDGSFYVAGNTLGNVAGTNPSPGNEDILLGKITADGHVVWMHQWGGPGRDSPARVAVDEAGSVYLAGDFNEDVYVTKRDANGNEVWTATWGTSGPDSATGIAVLPSGAMFVSGFFGGYDPAKGFAQGAFVSKVDAQGNLLFTHALGVSASDSATAVALGPSGDVFVTGMVTGELVPGAAQGSDDVFLYRLKQDGTVASVWQTGTTASDYVYDMAIRTDGKVFLACDTFGALPGFVNQGGVDAALLAVDP